MSIESDVTSVLRMGPVALISFRIDNIAVNKAQMESVAQAIERKDIAIEVAKTGGLLGAAYSSFTSRRWIPGEKKLIGRITLGSVNVVKTPLGKAAIFHESVHALMDVTGSKPTMQNDEVVAYIADALYLRATKTTISADPLEMAIFNAAFGLVDRHNMLAKPGVSLTWQNCDALRDAIKAHPAYHG